MDIVTIDLDMPDQRSAVKFRNQEKPVILVSAEKAAGDAKNFREAAALIATIDGERAKAISGWLNDLASKYTSVEAS